MVGGASLRQRIDARAQLVGERLPVFDCGEGRERDRRSDRDGERCSDTRLDLMEDQREAKRQAHMARDLE